MLIKEFRVVLPLTVEEYQIGQLFSVAEASKNETGGGEGVEIVRNEPFDDPEILGSKYPSGQYTFKIYHFKSKVPKLLNMILPSGTTEVHEHAWNAYPYCRTILTNPSFMKDNFVIKVETVHAPDRGIQENVHCLPADLLRKRQIQLIDIANGQVHPRDYKSHEDPKLFTSQATKRGPLNTSDWIETCEPVMCAYKLITVEFKWFGFQGRTEAYIMGQQQRLIMNFHRQLWCTIDRWNGLTMQQIRALEAETQRQLEEQRQKGPLRGSLPDDN